MLKASDKTTSLLPALLEARREISDPAATSVNPHFRSRYADLQTVLDEVRTPLLRHGILILSSASVLDAVHYIETRLIHAKSGEWVSATAPIHADKQNAHGSGSCMTYGRRQGLCAILGITADLDDDGNASAGVDEKKSITRSATKKRAAKKNKAPPKKSAAKYGDDAEQFLREAKASPRARDIDKFLVLVSTHRRSIEDCASLDQLDAISTKIRRDHGEGLISEEDIAVLRDVFSKKQQALIEIETKA